MTDKLWKTAGFMAWLFQQWGDSLISDILCLMKVLFPPPLIYGGSIKYKVQIKMEKDGSEKERFPSDGTQ